MKIAKRSYNVKIILSRALIFTSEQRHIYPMPDSIKYTVLAQKISSFRNSTETREHRYTELQIGLGKHFQLTIGRKKSTKRHPSSPTKRLLITSNGMINKK